MLEASQRKAAAEVPAGVALLSPHPRLVFPGPNGGQLRYQTAHQRLQALCDRVGVSRYSFHQIRHWAGMIATRMGKSKKAVADFLGHSDTNVTERYMHALNPEIWEVAKRLEKEMDGPETRRAASGDKESH
jgi:integrase